MLMMVILVAEHLSLSIFVGIEEAGQLGAWGQALFLRLPCFVNLRVCLLEWRRWILGSLGLVRGQWVLVELGHMGCCVSRASVLEVDGLLSGSIGCSGLM